MPKHGEILTQTLNRVSDSKPLESVSAGVQPYWQTLDKDTVKLYLGDCIDVMSKLVSKSVQCAVTSPPYWGLRDYQTGSEKELGCERKLDTYIENIVEVGRQVKKVLRDDGIFWLNLGDTYITDNKMRDRAETEVGNTAGIPWIVALALQDDGWILRQDCIWAKVNPMPESIQNRFTKSHEYIFMLVKKTDYYCDTEAVKEQGGNHRTGGPMSMKVTDTKRNYGQQNTETEYTTANKRDVFNVSISHFKGAHFATYPPKLIEPLIRMSTSEKGCCPSCGAPWKRITERIGAKRTKGDSVYERDRSFRHSRNGIDSTLDKGIAEIKTVGWGATCNCECKEEDLIPCTVLDPFIGSGTTAEVCILNNRRCWGVDLSEEYLKTCAIPRILKALPY